MTHNETRVSNERLDEQGLLAAGIAMAKLRGMSVADEVDQRMFGADAATVIRAYLQALRGTPVEAEPVAWHTTDIRGRVAETTDFPSVADAWREQAYTVKCLYAHPLPNPSPSDGEVSEAQAALERIAAIKYPSVDTHYALKATIDYARDQASDALQPSKRGQP